MLQPLFRGRAIAGGCIAFAAAAVITASALSPALGTGPEGVTSFSGTSSGAIVTSHNSGTGQAIVASGSTGASTGVIYATTAAAGSTAIRGYASSTSLTPSYGVIGVSKNAFGIEALSYSPTSPALFAYNVSTTTGTAIKGQSAGNAITGVSSKANGIVGQVSATPTPAPGSVVALAGVLGQDLSPGFNSANAGVVGTSPNNIGVYGKSTSYAGVYGTSNRYGVFGTSSSTGVFGVSTSGNGVAGVSDSGYGVQGYSAHNNGVRAISYATPLPNATTLPNSNNIYTAALAVFGFGGAPLIIARGNGGSDVMSLDNAGNLRIAGNLFANSSTVGTPGNPLAVHRTAEGRQIGTYAAEQTQRTIEDFGQGRLVNGQAYVSLESRFAATIDARVHYLVFLTPYGDNRGLYVAQQTHAGFLVRESQGGRSTLAFDYRIVAKPYDTNAPRLPLASLLPHPRPVTLPLLRNQTRFHGRPLM